MKEPDPLVETSAESEVQRDLREFHQAFLRHIGPVPRELLFSLLAGLREYFLLLDRDGAIVWCNSAFLADLPVASRGVPFRDLLTRSAAAAFDALREQASRDGFLDVRECELHHEAPAGVKVVSYRFVDHGRGRIAALGVDRSNEMEVVSQMSVLIEELEKEVNQRICLARQLEELATTDSLTGLLNRRRFDEILAQEWNRWVRYDSTFSLILLDLDRFKDVNDSFGHVTGDAVLQRVARALAANVREGDIVARIGGEEFAVIALGSDAEAARGLAERVVDGVRKATMPEPIECVTTSAGVASVQQGGVLGAEQLRRRADRALYAAKAAGRDRVEMYEDGDGA